MSDSKAILISGASSGIGKACAEYLFRRGHRVYGTSRHAQAGTPAAHAVGPGSLEMIQMDVCDDDSVAQAVDLILEREKRLDVVVNNAGIGIGGPIEDATLDEARSLFETNFFGALRVCKAVLPIMRKQRSGYIINISSMAGRVGAPYQGLYSASKFAVEGLTETLRIEVRAFGIRVVLIEPGDHRTGFTADRLKICRTPAYADDFKNAISAIETDEMTGPPPDKIGPLVERIIQNPSPRLRYAFSPAPMRILFAITLAAPRWLVEWGLRQRYNLHSQPPAPSTFGTAQREREGQLKT